MTRNTDLTRTFDVDDIEDCGYGVPGCTGDCGECDPYGLLYEPTQSEDVLECRECKKVILNDREAFPYAGGTWICEVCLRQGEEEARLLDTRAWIRTASDADLQDEVTFNLAMAEFFLEENVDVADVKPYQLRALVLLRELKRRHAA